MLGLRGAWLHPRPVLTTAQSRSYSLLPTVHIGAKKLSYLSKVTTVINPGLYSCLSDPRAQTLKQKLRKHPTNCTCHRRSLYHCLLSSIPPILGVSPAEREPWNLSPDFPTSLLSCPSLGKFWGEDEAMKIDGLPLTSSRHRHGAFLCTTLINDTCCQGCISSSCADRKA